jgi:hypothetical protein
MEGICQIGRPSPVWLGGPDYINGSDWPDPIIIGLHVNKSDPYGPCGLIDQPDPFNFIFPFILSFLCHSAL